MKYLGVLILVLSSAALAKVVDPLNPQVVEYMRADNSSGPASSGDIEITDPHVEGAEIEWNPLLVGNKHAADLFCKMMGYGESVKNHGGPIGFAETWFFFDEKVE